jgi:hypothetical protein
MSRRRRAFTPITDSRRFLAIMVASHIVFSRSRGARHEMIEQADAMRFLGLDDPAGEEQLLGHGPADLVGERPGAVDAAIGGGQEAEAGVLAPDAHVEGGGQHAGSAVGQAVDHPDVGLGQALIS